MPKKTKYTRKYTSISDAYKRYKRDRTVFNNRKEFNKVAELDFRLDIMKDARHSNCYWGVDGGLYQSWDDWWNYITKATMMWKSAPSEDNPGPNLKSTFIYNATETAMTELYDLNLMPSVLPWTRKGETYAQAIENIIKYPILRHNLNYVWLDAFQEALWLGNSYLHTTYSKIVRKVKVKKLKDFTKEELKRLEKNEDVAIYQDKEIIEYNDIDWLNVSPYEYYPDPYARNQHGRNYSAVDGIWERNLSHDQFLAEFGNKRGFVNIDKVKSGMEEIDSNPLFRAPETLEGTDNVVVHTWENKAEDFVRYTANGIFIGEMPLPNHKQLSFVHIGAIKIPRQYYHMGLGDIIIGLQTEDEVMRNSFLELLEIALKPPIIANNQVAGEFKDQWEQARYNTGEIISISGNPSEVQWMMPAMSKLSEVFGMRAQIKDDVISVSMFDPKASSQPTNSPTAYEAMQLTTATMKSFAKLMKSFGRGMGVGFKLQWELQKQEYPLQMEPEKIESMKGDKSEYQYTKNLKTREIYTDGVRIEDNDGEFKIKKTPGKKNPFYIKDEYLELDSDDCDIIISPESQQPMSKIARIKKSEEALAQLMPLLMSMRQDPTIQQDPRIMALFKDYVQSHDLDDDLLQGESEDPEKAVEKAQDQHAIMWKNSKVDPEDPKFDNLKPVLGEFGESLTHRVEHLKRYNAIQKLVNDRQKELDKLQTLIEDSLVPEMPVMPEGMPPMPGIEGMPMGQATPMPGEPQVKKPSEREVKVAEKRVIELVKEIEQLERFLSQLLEHYEVDRMSFEQAQEVMMAKEAGMKPGQENAMPVPPPPPGMEGVPPMAPQGAPIPPQGGEMPPMDIPSPTSQNPQAMQMMAS